MTFIYIAAFTLVWAALLLSYLSFLAFDIKLDYDYLIFSFSSTICLYCLHRFIGINKLENHENKGRFKIISEYKSHILLYASLSGLLSLLYFFYLSWDQWTLLFVPCLISLLYAIPFLSGKRRLRDIAYIKIFLIAIIWSWITLVLPLLQSSLNGLIIFLLFIERAFYVFAITIPFDIRDHQIDMDAGVKTIVSKLGFKNSYLLSYALILTSILLLLLLYIFQAILFTYFIAISMSYLLSIFVIYYSKEKNTITFILA